jgi:hypothetical protein
MAPKLKKRVVKAVTNALWKRDQLEMRAVDALLSTVERPRKRPPAVKRRRP